MKKFKQNKLWRDGMVDKRVSEGSKIDWTRLNDADFAQELRKKFIEEAEEVAQAPSKEALIEELADILEVVDSLCELHQIAWRDVVEKKIQKHQEKGGFQGRRFVKVAEHPPGSPGETYCLKDPDKYPELL